MTTTAREVAPEILSQFWTLASEDGEARRRACEALVGALRGEHHLDAKSPGGGGASGGKNRPSVDDESEDEDASSGDDEETHGRASEGVKEYALRRLTRGLSSGRGGARQGFALALCELACEASGPSPKEALQALDANLAPITKGTKGMEARDILLGRLFGAAAVARALESRKDVSEEERVECGASVVERARALAKEKAYLAEPAAACVIEVKNSLGAKAFANVAERVEGLGEWLSADCSADAGADTLWLACELYDALPAKMRETIGCVPQTAGSSSGKKASKGGVNWAEMFTRTHLRKISNALTEGANTHPRVHSAWEMMLREAKKVGGNVQLWETVCEDGLFVSGSHHKRFLGFRIFDSMLSEAEAHEIPALFSANFVKCLLNNLSSPDNYLHECAVDCLARIVAFASDKKTDSEKKIAVIAALQRQGPTRFDNVTKTNAVQDLVKGLDADDATRYMESMYDVVTTAPEQDPDVLGTEEELASALANGAGQKRRLWALEQMAGLSAMLPREKTVELMQFMLFHAFYKLSGKATKTKSRVPDFIRKAPLGEPTGSVRAACATRFLAMINSNIRAQRSAANKDDESKAEVVDLLTEAVTFSRDLEKDKSVEMYDVIPGEYQEVRDELFKALDACDASDDDLAAKVTPLIRVLSLLQVSDWREFTPALQDLPRCVGELIDAKKKKRSKKGDEEEPQAIDVLTDILFSLLAQPSALLRDVVEHTFKAVSGRVSKEGIQDMLRIIAGPEVTGEGDEDEEEDDLLTEADDSDDSEEEDSEEEEDDDSDDDDEDDSEGEEDYGEANEAEIAAMRAAASKVVGTTNDDDDDDSESEDMDDAAMFRIDKLLAEAFKSRQQDLMRKKNLKRATRDFKFRVISLFELYAKAQPGSAYLPGAAVTLLDATREALGKQDPQSTQLAERLASLISKHISHARDLPELIGDEVTAESLQAGLKSIIVATNKGAGEAKVFNRASSAAAAYLLRVLEAVVLHESGAKAPAAGEEVASSNSTECFREALEMFKSKRSKLKTSFFSQMFARHPALAAALLPELFGLVALDADKANARGEFLRLEALKLVNPVIQSSKKRYPSLAKSVKKSIKLVSASLAAAIAAPYKNKNTRADACQQVAVCVESLDRLLGDASIKAIIDVDAITGAIAKQMSKPPALPQKASKAFARICNLLGCAVPDVEMREANDEDEDEDDGGDSDSDVAPEKPKKKSKDEKKRKKSAGDASAKKKKTKK